MATGPHWWQPRRWGPPLVAAGVLIACWQLVAVHDRYVLPRPASVVATLAHHPGLYLHASRITLGEALLGLLIGYLVGVLVAIVMSQVAVVDRAVLPLAVLLNVTPVVAVAPALDVAFGFGMTPKVIMTAVMCFFPTLINATVGLRSADPQALEVLATLHASRVEVLLRVRLPSSLPFLFTAARVSFPLSVIGAVVAELVSQGSTSGLGTVIAQSASNSQLAQVYAAVVCLAVLGVALTGAVLLLERRLLSWHHSQQHLA